MLPIAWKTYIKPVTRSTSPCTPMLEEPENTHRGVHNSGSSREGMKNSHFNKMSWEVKFINFSQIQLEYKLGSK